MEDKEPLRWNLKRALERESQAFDARIAAFLKVKATFLKHGRGPETHKSMRDAEVADTSWRAAKAEADRVRRQARAKTGLVVESH